MQVHWPTAGDNELSGVIEDVEHKYETRFRRSTEMEIDFFGLRLPKSQMHVEDLRRSAVHGVRPSNPMREIPAVICLVQRVLSACVNPVRELVPCANLDATSSAEMDFFYAVPAFGILLVPARGRFPHGRTAHKLRACLAHMLIEPARAAPVHGPRQGRHAVQIITRTPKTTTPEPTNNTVRNINILSLIWYTTIVSLVACTFYTLILGNVVGRECLNWYCCPLKRVVSVGFYCTRVVGNVQGIDLFSECYACERRTTGRDRAIAYTYINS